MQTAIHDPYADATPYMRKEAAERRARLERMDKIVPQVTKPIIKSIETVSAALSDLPIETWEQRQRRIHGKKLWFSIDAEIAPQEPRRPQVEHIQEVVAKNYNVTRDDILSARRQANVVRPRMIAVYLAKTLTLKSLPEIGRRFGNRDHTTILHSTRKIDQLCKTDPIFKSHVDALTAAILERC